MSPIQAWIGEGNGTPLQYSCLENTTGRGAWWAAVHGVMKSPTPSEQPHFHFSLSCIGEGNGNPLQCSCLENPRDGGTWWAAVCGVTQSQTWLKRLSSSSSNSRLPCPSRSPGVCSNACLLSQWYHPTISSSVAPFSSCPQSFPTSGSFPVSQLFSSGDQSFGTSASAPVLAMNIQS